MKRNWLVVAILALITATLFGCGHYVVKSTEFLKDEIATAYAYALDGQFDDAIAHYDVVTAIVDEKNSKLGFLVRRSSLDKVNETITTLRYYAAPDNLHDLGVETARACQQLDQLSKSFFGRF